MSNKIIISTPEEIKILFKECIYDSFNQIRSVNKDNISMEFLDAKQASLLLNIKIQSLYNLVNKRKIPFIKVRKQLLFSKKELSIWMKAINLKTQDQ